MKSFIRTACVAVLVPLLAVGVSQADYLTQDQVRDLCVNVTLAAHPSAVSPSLTNYTQSFKNGIHSIKMNVEYRGALSNNRYSADALVRIRVPANLNEPLEVLSIDFVDYNNSIPPSRSGLQRLIDLINSHFRVSSH